MKVKVKLAEGAEQLAADKAEKAEKWQWWWQQRAVGFAMGAAFFCLALIPTNLLFG